jgi:hypothetical protein
VHHGIDEEDGGHQQHHGAGRHLGQAASLHAIRPP